MRVATIQSDTPMTSMQSFTNKNNKKGQKTMKAILAVLALITLGLINSHQRADDLAIRTVNTCNESQQQLNRYVEACRTLIQQVEADGHHEVLSDPTGYYVETRR
jgi:hypothetical protein